MSFANWGEFWAMGGHGFYVWTAYGIGLLVLLGNAFWPLLAKHRLVREYRRDKARRERREQGRSGDNP